ncbi:MAG: hypothetical protein GX639_17295 [Fibrobacter sp.]|nr:hypothetical protein [Fibrobacter sp.]
MGRNVYIVFLSVVVMVGIAFSQEQHPKKVYVDKATKRVYWPVGKQFFVKLSESADSAAPSYVIGARDSAKGYNLFLTGLHSFRWIEPYRNDTVHFHFTADGERPRSQMQAHGKRFVNQKTYYGKGLFLVFTASDRHSGVENVYMAVDSGSFQIVKDTISFDKQKEYTIRYYALDRVGNSGTIQTQTFTLDLSAPVSSLLLNKGSLPKDPVLSSKQQLQLVAIDSLSGVKDSWFKFDSNARFSRTGGTIYLGRLAEGEHSISFYSVDNVGVAEDVKTVSFYIDNTPPAIRLAFTGDYFTGRNDIAYVSPRASVTIEATDNKSGLDRIEYASGDGAFTAYKDPIIPSGTGKTTLTIRAVDKRGNVSPLTYKTIQVDAKAPQSKNSVNGNVYKNANQVYLTPASKITLTASDDLSGVKEIRYLIDNESDTVYNKPFSLSGDGRHVVRYFAKDNVGNVEDTQALVIVVDTTSPKIIETFSSATSKSDDLHIVKVPKSTSLFLAAQDNAAGVTELWYSIDKKKDVKYVSPIVFEYKGTYTIDIKCQDNIGNKTEKTITIEVAD